MSQVKERPILFSGPMVRAILEGRKTVTRRPVKGGQIPTEDAAGNDNGPRWSAIGQRHPSYGYCVFGETEEECAQELAERGVCPYGRPGDRLWVRETWGLQVRRYGGGTGEHIVYRATNPDAIYCKSAEGREYPVKWKPSIHMHRHSSRILLEITEVRVERLQAITWEQALDEGIGDHRFECDRPAEPDGYPACSCGSVGYVDAFADLWNSTGGDWDANPWVWVVEFRRVQP